jgi:hypothetical protein
MKFILLVFILFSVVGCSKKALYSNLQQNHISVCERLKSNQYEDCMSQFNDSYEDYTEKRQ